MARYYEETALIEFVKKYTPTINGETTMKCVARAIREAPTADVVPKSKYDAVVSAVDNSTKEFLKLHDKYQEAKREVEILEREVRLLTENTITAKYSHCVIGSYYAVLTKSLEDYEKVIADISSAAKAEVAREIFEEIERTLDNYHYSNLLVGEIYPISYYDAELEDAIAELKKKYTEEK